MRKLLLVPVLLASALLLYGCAAESSAPVSGETNKILTITFTGGLCAENGVCGFSYGIYSDGHFDEHTPLTQKEIVDLQKLLAVADFSKLVKSENPTCTSYYDGQDLGILLPDMETAILPCEYGNAMDNELIAYITGIVNTHPLLMMSN